MQRDLVLFRSPIIVFATTVVILGGSTAQAQTPSVLAAMLKGLTWAPTNFAFSAVDDPLGIAGLQQPGQNKALGTIPYGINASLQIAGAYVDRSGTKHDFVIYRFATHNYSTLDNPLGTASTLPIGINNYGEVAGSYQDNSRKWHGFLYGSTYTTVDDPSGTEGTQASGINDAGQIVGTYFDSSGTKHGFLDSGGTYSTLDPLGSKGTQASGINNASQIVGSYEDSSGTQHGFLYSGGTYTPLDDPLATKGTQASGLNDEGQIVGTYSDGGGAHGFLYSDGIYTAVDDPLHNSRTITLGVNMYDQIVGAYADTDGTLHGFLAKPTPPTPGTAATVTYSFMISPQAIDAVVDFQPITSSDQTLIEQVLQTFSTVANVNFTLVPNGGNADIMFGESNQNGTSAYTNIYWLFVPSQTGLYSYTAAHTYFATNNPDATDPVNVFLTLHELGNATGLTDFSGASPAQDAALGLPASEANWDYTVMATNQPPGNVGWLPQCPTMTTPALLDIEALQYLYGANQTGFTAGATSTPAGLVYSFNTNNCPESIWVGSAVAGQITFDFSACSGPVTINLNAGSFSSTGVTQPSNSAGDPVGWPYNNISIAYGTVVQNAIGNDASDIFYGNNAGDTLTGGTGTDIFFIGGGNTKVITQGGINTVVFHDPQANYTIDSQPNGTTVVTETGGTQSDGTTTIIGSAALQFSGATFVATTDDGRSSVTTGHVVTITMLTSTPATVTGAPTLQLNDNEVATYVSGSGGNALVFTYTVQAGDSASDLTVTGINLPAGATVQNTAGTSLATATGELSLQVNGT
jgi:probable HAF family extracellular repeat protein